MVGNTVTRQCTICGNSYETVPFKGPGCGKCEAMEKLHPDLPQYVKDCIQKSIEDHERFNNYE